MATKARVSFLCNNCGSVQVRWMGRCPDCGEFNTLSEFSEPSASTGRGTVHRAPTANQPIVSLDDIDVQHFVKHPVGIPELDRVLGGGLVEGSVVLLAGEPGIGKSTLALQILEGVHRNVGAQRRCAPTNGNGAIQSLYVSAEESLTQIKQRLQRLGLSVSPKATQETNPFVISEYIEKEQPVVVIVDSVQTLHHPELGSAPGTVAQVRECAAHLIQTVKTKAQHTALLFIGHVTKDGSIAGPRVLEHMVDTVLFFEGERVQALRMLRTYKNRFGASHELGLFEMTRGGLLPISDLAAYFDHPTAADTPGSAWTVAMEGSRPLAVEIQALTIPSSFVPPRRVINGLDSNRVAMILAILEKHCGLRFGQTDVYLNVVGGFKITDTASDLAIAMAVASSLTNQALKPRSFFCGEMGLAGEIRQSPQTEVRQSEAQKFSGHFEKYQISIQKLSESLFHFD